MQYSESLQPMTKPPRSIWSELSSLACLRNRVPNFPFLASLTPLLLTIYFLNLARSRKMAEEKSEPPRHIAYYRQARDLALGAHPLSKYGPPLLLLFDALLTSLIISKVACEFKFNSTTGHSLLMLCRHGNRLEGVHGAGRAICERRT